MGGGRGDREQGRGRRLHGADERQPLRWVRRPHGVLVPQGRAQDP
jgi:hypothetical protein